MRQWPSVLPPVMTWKRSTLVLCMFLLLAVVVVITGWNAGMHKLKFSCRAIIILPYRLASAAATCINGMEVCCGIHSFV